MSAWVKVAAVADINDHAYTVVHNSRRIALFRLDDGIYAMDDQCSHAQGSLSAGEVYGDQVECPQHGALFNIKTGKNLSFPAVTPVKSYLVKVENGDVFIDINT
jgi:nitrite reductase/ring-hydroxylating ferredoxin subunit